MDFSHEIFRLFSASSIGYFGFWGIFVFSSATEVEKCWFSFYFIFHTYLANVNRCDLPQIRIGACVSFCWDVAVSHVVETWKQGTQMNWINAKCGFCFSFIALEFLSLFVSSLFLAIAESDFFCMCRGVFRRSWFVCVQSIAFHFLAFLSFLSPDWFFCSILRNSWHTLPPPVCFGHVSALCSRTHRPLHITVVPVESGCKIPRKPKIWKRREESIIKLQRIERSAKLRMSCRRRPTDSLSLDKSMDFCMSGTHFISVWTLAWASNTRRW